MDNVTKREKTSAAPPAAADLSPLPWVEAHSVVATGQRRLRNGPCFLGTVVEDAIEIGLVLCHLSGQDSTSRCVSVDNEIRGAVLPVALLYRGEMFDDGLG